MNRSSRLLGPLKVNRLTGVNVDLTAVKDQIQTLSNQLTLDEAQITTLSNQVAANSADIAGLEEAVALNADRIDSSAIAIAGIEVELLSLDSAVLANTAGIQTNSLRIDSLSNEVSSIEFPTYYENLEVQNITVSNIINVLDDEGLIIAGSTITELLEYQNPDITLNSLTGTGFPAEIQLLSSFIPSLDSGNPHRMLGNPVFKFLEVHAVAMYADIFYGPPAEGGTVPRRVLLEGDTSHGLTVPWDDVTSKPGWVDKWGPGPFNSYAFSNNLTVTDASPFDAFIECTGEIYSRKLFVENELRADIIAGVSSLGSAAVFISGPVTDPNHAVTKTYADALVPSWVSSTQANVSVLGFGGTAVLSHLTYDAPSLRVLCDSELNMQNHALKNLADPVNSLDAVNRSYAQANFAQISANDNRLILEDPMGSTTLSCFTIGNVGPLIAPPEISNYDIIALNSITPTTDNTYNLGQFGRTWRFVYSKALVSENLFWKTGGELAVGSLNSNADVVLNWKFVDYSLLPWETRTCSIGSPQNEIWYIYTEYLEVSNWANIPAVEAQFIITDELLLNNHLVWEAASQLYLGTRDLDDAVSYYWTFVGNDLIPFSGLTNNIGNATNRLSGLYTHNLDVSGSGTIVSLNVDTMTCSNLNMNSSRITSLADPLTATDAVTKAYADALVPSWVEASQANVSALGFSDAAVLSHLTYDAPNLRVSCDSELNMSDKRINNLGSPINSTDAATKQYVDAHTTTDLTSVSANIVPSVNSTYDLGSSANKWRFIYSNTISAGSISCTGQATCGSVSTGGILATSLDCGSGDIICNSVTVAAPTASGHATRKSYVDAAISSPSVSIIPSTTGLTLGALGGNIWQTAYIYTVVGTTAAFSDTVSVGTPTSDQHAARKDYVDAGAASAAWMAQNGLSIFTSLEYTTSPQTGQSETRPKYQAYIYIPLRYSDSTTVDNVYIRWYCPFQKRAVSQVATYDSTVETTSRTTYMLYLVTWKTMANLNPNAETVKFSVAVTLTNNGVSVQYPVPSTVIINKFSWSSSVQIVEF